MTVCREEPCLSGRKVRLSFESTPVCLSGSEEPCLSRSKEPCLSVQELEGILWGTRFTPARPPQRKIGRNKRNKDP
ncbi:hypothetical protein NDU88_000038 [Pleurodeles waltl]|uniref:Uncharacterized protein n=1 Tax=Pleurodeles waltl TaxID=8319 RepID=A0AAV7KSF4_PLEWA|nr:hypothetical protein NDU88_000038 [Pleurodeles waltl]